MNTTILVCPKCRGDMRVYERNGVTVEQCGECRGLFLDRGELERLIDAEDRFYAGRDTGRSDARPRDDDPYRSERDTRDRRYDERSRGYDDDRGRGSSGNSGGPPRKRSSFLGDLLDFG